MKYIKHLNEWIFSIKTETSDKLYKINEGQKKSYNMIGFANKFYTLWEVIEDDVYIEYKYRKNLSFDLEVAKQKAETDLFNEKLRGKTKSFVSIKYSNGMEQEFEIKQGVSVDYVLDFGKYKGQKIIDIADKDPLYLAWIVDNLADKKPKLVTFISSLLPVKNVLENDPKYKKRTAHLKQLELSFKEQVDLAILDLERDSFERYGLDLKFSQNKKNPKILESSKFTITERFNTLYPVKADRIPRVRNKKSKYFFRDIQLNNSRLITSLKLDPKHYFNILKIDNITPEELESTPKMSLGGTVLYYIFDYKNKTFRNREYELTGTLKVNVHDALEFKNSYSYTFDVKKLYIK